MQSEFEHHPEYLLILPQLKHRDQTKALKFIGLTATQEMPLAVYTVTLEIIVYTAWIWKCAPFHCAKMKNLNAQTENEFTIFIHHFCIHSQGTRLLFYNSFLSVSVFVSCLDKDRHILKFFQICTQCVFRLVAHTFVAILR